MSAVPVVDCCRPYWGARRPGGGAWCHSVNCPLTPTERVLTPELEAKRLAERRDCAWHVRAGVMYLTSGVCHGPLCETYFAYWGDRDDDLREAAV